MDTGEWVHVPWHTCDRGSLCGVILSFCIYTGSEDWTQGMLSLYNKYLFNGWAISLAHKLILRTNDLLGMGAYHKTAIITI